MASTDRAFRALARVEPDIVLKVLRTALVDFMPDATLDPNAVEDPQLDLPPPIEADLVARTEDEILHVEGQGYRDDTFEYRLFRYHLLLVLRHPGRRVRTVALWLSRPTQHQRLDRVAQGGVSIDVETVVLAELPAARLLASPDTVCFASGAHGGDLDDGELCSRIARELASQNAGWQRLLLCLALARTTGRYGAMIDAMKQAQLEIPIIEDFVHMGREQGLELGREQGLELGREQGLELGLRTGIFELLSSRDVTVDPASRDRIEREHDPQRLTAWLRRAATCRGVEELFED